MTILIPAFEPDNRMIDLIVALKTQLSHPILLVDDGSGPAFAPLFDEAERRGCTVLLHDGNRGKGAALKTGFHHLREAGETEGVVCADSDGQHTPEDIARIITETLRATDTVVLGVRAFTGKVPLRSRFGNTLTRQVFQWSAGYRISDTQTGLRGYPASMLPWLCGIAGDRFEYEMNLLLAMKPDGWRMREVPIQTVYDPVRHSSHFRPLRDAIRVYLPFLRFSASSLLAFFLDFLLVLGLTKLTGNLLFSVITARVASALANYLCNLSLVFTGKTASAAHSAPRYFLLAAVLLGLNYLMLRLLITLGLPLAIAKLVVEGTLFLLSYQAQKRLVFRHMAV